MLTLSHENTFEQFVKFYINGIVWDLKKSPDVLNLVLKFTCRTTAIESSGTNVFTKTTI